LKAFAETWNEQRKLGGIAEHWPNPEDPEKISPQWKILMIGKAGSPSPSILGKMLEKFRVLDTKMKFRYELYTVDVAIVGGTDTFQKDLRYPSSVYAVIEHEMNWYPEEEMWKLLHWRCPLKVLITYDYTEDQKKGRPSRQTWLDKKIETLWQMRDAVDGFQGDEQGTNYLFLIGETKYPDGQVGGWRYASSEPDGRRPRSLPL
jgi:hypothetical protein